eukprot:2020505-Amphidinium_carterae.1
MSSPMRSKVCRGRFTRFVSFAASSVLVYSSNCTHLRVTMTGSQMENETSPQNHESFVYFFTQIATEGRQMLTMMYTRTQDQLQKNRQ